MRQYRQAIECEEIEDDEREASAEEWEAANRAWANLQLAPDGTDTREERAPF